MKLEELRAEGYYGLDIRLHVEDGECYKLGTPIPPDAPEEYVRSMLKHLGNSLVDSFNEHRAMAKPKKKRYGR